MLATESAESRFDFGARKDLYTAYVPFAVAAGAAALWAQKYETTTGTPAPQPDWYHSSSSAHRSSGFIGRFRRASFDSFDSFESALSSSIGAYTASQSSSIVVAAAVVAAPAAAVAVAAAAEVAADHGEAAARHRADTRGAGAGRFRAGLQQDSQALTSGLPRRCPVSTSS